MNFSNNNQKLLAMTLSLLIVGMMTPAFANIGTDPSGTFESSIIIAPSSLDLNDNGAGVTFTGKGGYSADGMGAADDSGTLSANIPVGSTIESAYLYATTFDFSGNALDSVDIDFDGTVYTLDIMSQSEYDGCCDLRSFKHTSPSFTAQVAAKFVSDGPGVINFAINEPTILGNSEVDGTALVVIFSNPANDDVSIAVLDGGLGVTAADTTVFFADPLDTTGLEATLALGIGFGFQGTALDPHACMDVFGPQRSSVDINTLRLTTCAGGSDDRESDESSGNGNLFTVGGFDDSPTNPVDPFADSGSDDELYDLTPFLSDGDTEMLITTTNFSADDIIFLAIIQINRAITIDEKCGDGIDNDDDGLIDEGCVDPKPQPPIVGGNFLPIDSTSLLIAGMSANLGLIVPIAAGIAGAGAYFIRTRMNKE